MKKNICLIIITLITAVLMTGCENLYHDVYNSANPNVYVAGMEIGTASYDNALYWKNGELHRLTNYTIDGSGPYAKANSIFVYKGKAYIAGIINDYTPFYSIDGGALVELPQGTTARSVFVYNDDVYVAGEDELNTDGYVWKNSVASDPYVDYGPDSIFVYNGDVYVAGDNAVYKNDAILNSYPNEIIRSVFIYSGDVYVAANRTQTPTYAHYYKNNIENNLYHLYQSEAYSIFVHDGDVYVAGYNIDAPINKMRAVYWKNGQMLYLTDGSYNAEAYSIFVYNGDVYVAGYEDNSSNKEVAKYWKNGREVIISSGTYSYRATSIFVSGE